LLIEQSFKKIPYEHLDEIKEHYSKIYWNIFKNSNIESYYPQLIMKLEKQNIIFNNTLFEIHFQNGYMDFKENVFKKRILNTHYITEFITRDYEPSLTEQKIKY